MPLVSAAVCSNDSELEATNFSIAEIGATGPQTIQMYCAGSYIGTYNTTSNDIPIPPCDFTLTIKPELKNQDPLTVIQDLFKWLIQYGIAVVLGVGIVYIATRRW